MRPYERAMNCLDWQGFMTSLGVAGALSLAMLALM